MNSNISKISLDIIRVDINYVKTYVSAKELNWLS